MTSAAAVVTAFGAPPVSAPASAAADAVCVHCGSAIPAGAAAGRRFCCAGCEAAYSLVSGLGLEQYYARRTLDPAVRAPTPADDAAAAAGAPDGDPTGFAVADGEGGWRLHLMLDGLHCAACVWLIESVLAREPGIVEARVNLTTRRLRLRWTGEAARAAHFAGLVRRLGYRAVPFDPAVLAAAGAASSQDRELLRALAVAGFAAANVMLLSVAIWADVAGEMGSATRDLLHWVSALVALPAIAYAGRPFFRSAVAALRAGRTNMDVPISIGVTLAAAMSVFETVRSYEHAYFDSAITLLFFLLVGRYLDAIARGRARQTVEHLVGLMAAPVTVLDLRTGAVRQVAPAAVAVGQTVLVAAGERIGVDGRVLDGRSDLDRSLIDGETVPAPAAPGTELFAGTVNLTAPLRVVVTATGDGTLLAEIVRLVEAAEQGRARYVVLADRVARRYAPAVHLLALATFLGHLLIGGAAGWQQALLAAVAVLIITCPCALGLAVPIVQVVASGRLLRRGILLKSATALERLAEIDTIVFDKTGTLTLGNLELRRDAGPVDPDALREAASLAAVSRHPLSSALRRACPDAPAAADVEECPGEGLRRRAAPDGCGEIRLGSRRFCGVADADENAVGGGPELWLARPGRRPVRFVFADALRPDAAETVAALRAQGKRVLLLSGDRRAVVEAAAAAAGIDEWQAEVPPAGKAARLASLAAEGARVMMVGDGINDAPSLAAAHVSMSPSTAAAVSQTAADVVFQGRSLSAVTGTLSIARLASRLVVQNIGLAIGYNAFAVPLAMAGYVTPLVAAAAMSSSSLLVVGNALRLHWRTRS